MVSTLQSFSCAILLATFITVSLELQLPSHFKVCRKSDENIDECLKEAIQDALPKFRYGVKELHMPPMEPLTIKEVTIAEGPTAVRFTQYFKNFEIHNLTTSTIEKAQLKFEDDKISFIIDSDSKEIVFDSDYEISGRVLLFPITGNGKCLIKLKSIKSHVIIATSKVMKKNVEHLKVDSVKLTSKIGQLVMKFDNLFDGNKELGDNINQVLNDNWQEIYADLGRNYEELFETVYLDYINKLFNKVPYASLLPE